MSYHIFDTLTHGCKGDHMVYMDNDQMAHPVTVHTIKIGENKEVIYMDLTCEPEIVIDQEDECVLSPTAPLQPSPPPEEALFHDSDDESGIWDEEHLYQHIHLVSEHPRSSKDEFVGKYTDMEEEFGPSTFDPMDDEFDPNATADV